MYTEPQRDLKSTGESKRKQREMYCTTLWNLDRPSSIHTDAPTPYFLQGDTHLRTQIKPLEQVPLAEREMEVGNGGGHQGYGGGGVGNKEGGLAWMDAVAL